MKNQLETIDLPGLDRSDLLQAARASVGQLRSVEDGPTDQKEHLPLLVARRSTAKKPQGAAHKGRPAALRVSFESAFNLAILAVLTTAADRGTTREADEAPSLEVLSTWEIMAARLKISSWQMKKACVKAIEAGPQPPLPSGFNFSQSTLVRPGMSELLRAGVYEPEDMCELLGVKEDAAIRIAETSLKDLYQGWSRARAKAGVSVIDETRGSFAPGERETARALLEAHSSEGPDLQPAPWVAVCSLMRRLCQTRQGYLPMPRLALVDGSATEVAKRLSTRAETLQQYLRPPLGGWSVNYSSLDLGDLLSDANMLELHHSMQYGSETSLLQLRREVIFSRLGVIDRFVVAQLQAAPECVTYPLEIDRQGEVPEHVEEALAPLLRVDTGLTNRTTGRPLDGRELFLSEVLTDRPWEARQALLRAAFDAALSPWSW